jgi:hypothetical protein
MFRHKIAEMPKSTSDRDADDFYRSDAAREFYALKAAALRELSAQCQNAEIREQLLLLSQKYEQLVQISALSQAQPLMGPRRPSMTAIGNSFRAARRAAVRRHARVRKRLLGTYPAFN